MARKLIDLTGATITFREDKLTYERVKQFTIDYGAEWDDPWFLTISVTLNLAAYSTSDFDVLVTSLHIGNNEEDLICEAATSSA